MQMSKSFGGGPGPMQVRCRARVTILPTLAGCRANSPSVAGAEHWSTSARIEEPFLPLHIIHSPSISSAVEPSFDILTFTSYQPLAAHVVILPAGQSHVCFGAAAGQACRRRRLAGMSELMCDVLRTYYQPSSSSPTAQPPLIYTHFQVDLGGLSLNESAKPKPKPQQQAAAYTPGTTAFNMSVPIGAGSSGDPFASLNSF